MSPAFARPRRDSRASLLIVPLAALAVAGCLPTPVTEEGKQTANLYGIFVAIAAVVAVIVLGLTIFAIVRYRKRPGDDDAPRQVHGNLRYEAVWTTLPILTIVGLLVLTVGVLNSFDQAAKATTGVDIRVTGFRWGWRFEYPADNIRVEGIRTPGPEVYVPVGEPVHVTLTGADVIHAFFVPQFLFKRDAIPGRETGFAFTVDEPGRYGGQCAEFCGIYHSQMPFTIVAVPPAEYRSWLAAHRGSGGSPAPAAPSASATPSPPPSPSPSASPS